MFVVTVELASNLFTTFCLVQQNPKVREFLDDESERGERDDSERWSCGGSALLTNRDRTLDLKNKAQKKNQDFIKTTEMTPRLRL